MNPPDRHEYAAVVLDILGTMVDEPGGIERGIRTMVPGADDADVHHLVAVWNRHAEDQQAEILAARRPFADSVALGLETAARVAREAGVEDDQRIRSLASASQDLDPWADSASALARIASAYPVVGLSNASHRALTRINAHAGLRWHQVLSAADAGAYKPHPDVYRLAVSNAGCAPDRLLMVAAHAWDLRGAQSVGMRTAYVHRPVGDPPAATDSFDLHASSLAELAELLAPS